MKKLFFFFLVILFTSTIIQAQDTAGLKKKLQTMCDEYSKAMVSGDMSKMWSGYADDIISMPSYEPMLRGIEACKESFNKMKESGMKMSKFALTVTDAMQSGNFAIEIGTYKLTMEGGPLPSAWDDHGKYMNVWELQDDGSMKLKAVTWNSDVNPWMEMQKMQAPKSEESHEGHKH